MKEETAILPASIPNAPLTNTLPPTPMQATLSTNVANNAWPCTASQYEQGALISKGGFSTVLTGICKTNQQKICIKILELETMALSFEEVLQEIQLMRLCNDANILTFHTNFVHKEELWLITQLMDKGSCLRVMSISKALNLGEGFSEECLAFILAETLKGLHYLHSKSLIHRDVKPGNILLDSRGGVKVSDLALSGTMAVEVGQRAQKAKTVIGTPCYMAPEVLEQQQNQGGYDHRADIWSLGITALELAKGYAPYAHLAAMKIMSLTLDSDPPSLKNYPYDKQLSPTGPAFSKNYDDFYKQCLQKHPKHRPSAAELLKHRLVRSVTCDALVAFLQNIPNIDDIEATTSILGAAATSSNQTHNAHSTIADLLQEFEDLNLDANHAVTSTVWNNGDPATASDAPGLLSTHSSKSIDEGMKTPSRFVTSQRSFDDVDGANNQGNNNNNEHHRSRSLSNHLLDPSASDDPSATSSRDHPSAATTQQNSENNSAKLPFPGQIETHRDLSEDSKDATPGSTYIPGTTWVFETSVRGENGAFKSAQTIAAELQKKKSSEEERVMREEEGEGSNDIADFLDEFEEQEATIKTSSDKIQR